MMASDKFLVSTANDRSMVVLPFSVFIDSKELRLFMNVQKIWRVTECDDISPLPPNMKPFCGLYDLNQIPVPVLDLKTHFQQHLFSDSGQQPEVIPMPQAHKEKARRLIICNTMDVHVGLIVDQTRKVQTQSNAQISAPPTFFSNSVFCAVVKDDLGFRYLLDVESLLEKEGVELAKQTSYDGHSKDPLKGKRILFVDDSRYFQSLGKKLLEKFSAIVDIACNGQEALNKFTEHPDAYDLILTDIEMPIMSGIEMAKTVRKSHTSNIPIIFHSSISNAALINELKEQGVGDYIVKFDEKSIVEKVMQYTGAKTAA